MTDIEQALTEALAIATAGEASPEQHIKAWRAHQETLLPFESLKTRRMAEDVMAQEPMQAIARDAAVGRAVERLNGIEGDGISVRADMVNIHDDQRWKVVVSGHRVYQYGYGPTLDAAIAAALGDDHD